MTQKNYIVRVAIDVCYEAPPSDRMEQIRREQEQIRMSWKADCLAKEIQNKLNEEYQEIDDLVRKTHERLKELDSK